MYQEVNFTNNFAVQRGGAYFYPKFRPVFDKVFFENNSAPYGPNIGSLPIKIYINNSLS